MTDHQGVPHGYWRQLSDADIASKTHRDFVGGMWDELGRLQFDFLRRQGLQTTDRLLDMGCGSLRGGVHFIKYLKPGNYYGIDMNASLIKAGREVELVEAGLVDRRPNLLVNERFECSAFGVSFQMAIAQSLFTHLEINAIERCLVNIAEVLEPGGRLFATYFESPSRHHLADIEHPVGSVVTHSDADPFHYHPSLFAHLVEGLPLEVRNIGPWDHPRSQHVLEFVKTRA